MPPLPPLEPPPATPPADGWLERRWPQLGGVGAAGIAVAVQVDQGGVRPGVMWFAAGLFGVIVWGALRGVRAAAHDLHAVRTASARSTAWRVGAAAGGLLWAASADLTPPSTRGELSAALWSVLLLIGHLALGGAIADRLAGLVRRPPDEEDP